MQRAEDLRRVADSVSLPLVIGGSGESLIDPASLARQGVRMYSAGHQTCAVAMPALYDAMKAVREGTLGAKLPGAASKALMDIATDAQQHGYWMDEFLGSAQVVRPAEPGSK